jgi:predicted phosphohydrolase
VAAYGHLHGDEDHAWAPRGRYAGVELRFAAADFTGFAPVPIWEEGRGVIPEPPVA